MSSDINDQQLQAAIEADFQCERCGHCCKGDGLVHFGAAEADRMAETLGLNRRQFLKKYAIHVKPDQWILRDRIVDLPGAGSEIWCIFLERGPDGLFGCRVNAGKPDQCASFPRRWRNPDSFKTCAGLRRLMMRLRREARQGEPDAAG